jgi:O-acetyl-ADP-ribose deacetylase (regulator of RNase III)
MEANRSVIEFAHGDILQDDVEALVNTVNSVGIMGRGIALQFKKAYPDNYNAYTAACSRGDVKPGCMFIFPLQSLSNPRYIINFPTKIHWKGKSRIEYIESGLEALVADVRRLGIRSMTLPPLGCGLGGLNWEEVRPRIERAFAALPEVRVLLHEPEGAPQAAMMVRDAKPPNMTPGRGVLLGLTRRYLAGLMDTSISLLEIHKLAYLMQEAGEPLKLRYSKANYGPYSENMRHALNAMEGHFIVGFADAADSPTLALQVNPEAVEQAEQFLSSQIETKARMDRLSDLIAGFESPFGMELLTTVHWVATHENATDADAAIERVYAWSSRKRMFSERQIRIGWQALSSRGWLQPIHHSD